jgi:hypothetical protein
MADYSEFIIGPVVGRTRWAMRLTNQTQSNKTGAKLANHIGRR